MRAISCLAAVAVLLLLPRLVAAEPFTILPNGDLVFNVALTTTGRLTCHSSVPCTGSGTDTITIGTGANVATIRFTGVETTVQAGNVATPVGLGQIESSAPEGFTFPEANHPAKPVVSFSFRVTHSSPVEGDFHGMTWEFFPGGGPILPLTRAPRSSLSLKTGPNPPGYNYTALVYTFDLDQEIPSNGIMELTADVGAIPEPGTLALLATGLAGTALRRRRRMKQPE